MISTPNAVLLSRLATKSGDHAWELALPIALTQAVGGSVRTVALLYLVMRVAQVISMSRLGAWADRQDRLQVMRTWICAQVVGVLSVMGLVLYLLHEQPAPELLWGGGRWSLLYGLVALMAALASVGTAVCQNALIADWVPCLFQPPQRTWINSRLKQIDLGCEVAAPLVAGVLLSPFFFGASIVPGVLLIAGWNVCSFAIEYALLQQVYSANALSLLRVPTPVNAHTIQATVSSDSSSWGNFWRQPVALTIVAYALLWCTVLSPHGAVLTSFLSAGAFLDQQMLGVFRAAGALSGIVPTVLVAALLRRWSVRNVGLGFICYQSACVLMAAAMLSLGEGGVVSFLVLVVFSRVGLYGYSLCEVQLRQELVPAAQRGAVSGKLSVLANLCALVIVGLSVFWGEPPDFPKLAWVSAGAVSMGALLVFYSTRRRGRAALG